jgi:hypothetical protein
MELQNWGWGLLNGRLAEFDLGGWVRGTHSI